MWGPEHIVVLGWTGSCQIHLGGVRRLKHKELTHQGALAGPNKPAGGSGADGPPGTWTCSHPFLLEADEAFVVIVALQLLWRLADQGAELGGHLPGLQHAEEAAQGGGATAWGRSLLLLQVVALLLSKVDENLRGHRRVTGGVEP